MSNTKDSRNGGNIFCVSNPAKMLDALWGLICDDVDNLADFTIFLPSARAVRSVEKFLVEKIRDKRQETSDKNNFAVLLPQLVPLGQGAEDEEDTGDWKSEIGIVSNAERVLVLAKLLSADASIKTLSNAMPLASDLVRMQDYLEKENAGVGIDWLSLVDEKYASHFRKKAEFLSLADSVMPMIFSGKITEAAALVRDIANWESVLQNRRRVIVCCTTVSIPMQSNLMQKIAAMPHGRIILSGDVRHKTNIINECDPYASELRFLEAIGVQPQDVQLIDVGSSNMEFFNAAFDNAPVSDLYLNAHRIDCARESEEAEVVSEIAARATGENKSVLIITPDAAGNQRIAAACGRRNLVADFSGGMPSAMTIAGRNILNAIDGLLEIRDWKSEIGNLFEFVEGLDIEFTDDDAAIIEKLAEVSDVLRRNSIELSLSDAHAVVKSALDSITIRPPINDDVKINVVSPIQSRMQTADVVILTGLNEGMFPASGYENAWLPRAISDKIGLPPGDKKISLMALDFMTLSCADAVYWTRSKTAGGSQTTESRFLSRTDVAQCRAQLKDNETDNLLKTVRALDDIPCAPLLNPVPTPPADRSDVYVTDIELLIHNPYAYYAKHILKLRPKDDWWLENEPNPRKFGIVIHEVIEKLSIINYQLSINEIVEMLDKYAREVLEPGSVVFHFWHKRFVEIAPAIEKLLRIPNAQNEIELFTVISGRRVRARADMVFDNVVLDIKTGAAPNKSQLEQGNMPQLPLEAYMIRDTRDKRQDTSNIVIQFLQLRNNDVRLIEYSGDTAKLIIDNTVQKVSELFGRYSRDFEPYEYYETSDKKYKAWDDLARRD